MRNTVFGDRFFRVAFAISLLSHSFLFMKIPSFSSSPSEGLIEVTYLEQKKENVQVKKTKSAYLGEDLVKKDIAKIEVAKGVSKEKEQIREIKKQESASKIIKKVSVEKIKEELPKKEEAYYHLPQFSDYYQYVRQRIKEAVIYPEPFKDGEVVISFTLFSNGNLKNISIIDDLSARSAYLRYAAIKSVREASPFEPFPKELTAGEIPFQISISFKLAN